MERKNFKDQINTAFGESLRKQRKKAKLTQGAAADRAGIALRYLQDLEAGRKSPSVQTAVKLCVALDIPSDDLLSPLINLAKKGKF